MKKGQLESNLTFLEHLAELRRSVFWCFFLFVVAGGFVHYYREPIIDFLLQPLNSSLNLQFLSPLDPIFFILKIDFTLGGLMVLPLVFFIIWHFIAPGVKKPFWYGLVIILITSFLALVGAWYSYQVVVPIVLNFMHSLVVEGIELAFTAQNYINFLLTTTVLLVLVFQIPLIIVLLSLLEIVDPDTITKQRPYLYTSTFVVAAIITPTTDVTTLLLVALPAIVVTEVGVIIAKLMLHLRKKTYIKKIGTSLLTNLTVLVEMLVLSVMTTLVLSVMTTLVDAIIPLENTRYRGFHLENYQITEKGYGNLLGENFYINVTIFFITLLVLHLIIDKIRKYNKIMKSNTFNQGKGVVVIIIILSLLVGGIFITFQLLKDSNSKNASDGFGFMPSLNINIDNSDPNNPNVELSGKAGGADLGISVKSDPETGEQNVSVGSGVDTASNVADMFINVSN